MIGEAAQVRSSSALQAIESPWFLHVSVHLAYHPTVGAQRV